MASWIAALLEIPSQSTDITFHRVTDYSGFSFYSALPDLFNMQSNIQTRDAMELTVSSASVCKSTSGKEHEVASRNKPH